MSLVIVRREQKLVNTDPQRRCYNGCHAKSELIWTPWEVVEHVQPEELPRRLEFWQELNGYAVSQRGIGAKREYKVEERS